jgi:hypothetical protein
MGVKLEVCVDTAEGLAQAVAGGRTGSSCVRRWRWGG